MYQALNISSRVTFLLGVLLIVGAPIRYVWADCSGNYVTGPLATCKTDGAFCENQPEMGCESSGKIDLINTTPYHVTWMSGGEGTNVLFDSVECWQEVECKWDALSSPPCQIHTRGTIHNEGVWIEIPCGTQGPP